MSHTDDTNPNRGRPVLKRLDRNELLSLTETAQVWLFCGEHEGSEKVAVDAAAEESGSGIYKVFPSGSWPGGYLRD